MLLNNMGDTRVVSTYNLQKDESRLMSLVLFGSVLVDPDFTLFSPRRILAQLILLYYFYLPAKKMANRQALWAYGQGAL